MKKTEAFLHKLFGTKPNDGEIQPRECIYFSIAGFGQNMICTIVGSYLTIFMTDAIGYPALSVALLMLFARIFDALNDPVMGSIVDRTRTPWGKCRPYLKWMAIPIAIMTVLCFLPAYTSDTGSFVAISIVYVLWSVVYTVADVPYWSLTTAMTNDTYKRGNLLTVARLVCTLGAGIVTIILPMVTSAITDADKSVVSAITEIMTNLSGSDTAAFSQISNVYVALGSPSAFGDTIKKAVETLKGAGIDLNVSGETLFQLRQTIKADIANTLKYAYFTAAIICAVVAVPMFFLGFKNTKERSVNSEKAPSLAHNLKLLFKNKPLMLIVLSGILGAAKVGFTYTGGLYFAKYVLADVGIVGMRGEALYTIMTMAVVPGGIICSLLVPYLTKKIGKRNTYIWSHICGGVYMLIAFMVGWINKSSEYTDTATLVLMFSSFVIAGIPFGFGNVLTYAMIGDTVEYLEMKTGERAEGICFAMQTFISKIGMAVGAFIGVLAYHMAGITPNDPGSLNAADKDKMWIMLMLLGGLSMVASAIPLFFYKFNEKQQTEAVRIINERKLAALQNAENGNLNQINNNAED